MHILTQAKKEHNDLHGQTNRFVAENIFHSLSTHDMTWHLGFAGAPWPGYLRAP